MTTRPAQFVRRILLCLPLWLAFCGLPDKAHSAEPASPSAAEAHVSILNRKVAVFRSKLYGLTPHERAARAETRIHELLTRGGPAAVTIERQAEGNVILIDGVLALGLTPTDADQVSGQTLEQATEVTVAALGRVISETKEARDQHQMLRALTRASIATLGLVLTFALVWAVRRRVSLRLTKLLEKGAAQPKVAAAGILSTNRVVLVSRWLAGLFTWLLLAPLTYEWASFVLNQFPYTRAWSELIDDFSLGLLKSLALNILKGVPDLVVAVSIFLLARIALALAKPLFQRAERAERGEGWLDADTARPTRKIASVGVWAFAAVMAYPYLPGSDSEAFKGVTVFIGLMISLGGSSVFGQAASGMILMYSRSLRVGEYVRISEQEGTVTEIGTFTTKLRTGLGEEVSLPNSLVLGCITKNYSRAVQGRGYIVDTTVTIGYDVPWRQVEALLIEAAHRTPGVLDEPAPRVFKTALSDFYVEYRLVCQAVPSEPRPRAEVLHTLHSSALDVFNEHGVQIMSPHYLGDPSDQKIVAPKNWYAAPAQRPLKSPA